MDTTVSQFAVELKMPEAVLLQQLGKAGIVKQTGADPLTDQDKAHLLDYLRRAHGNGSKTTNTLTLKATSEGSRQFSLTADQIAFLAKHNISIDRVHFANGKSPSVYQPIMQAGGYTVAVGVTPCAKAGHKMRTRKGECVQCNTASLAFQARFETDGYIYVARSSKGKLTKVGVTNDLRDREYMLNCLQYGGCSDWQIRFSKHVNGMGEAEAKVLKSLRAYKADGHYKKQGMWVRCAELLNCPPETAIAAIEMAIKFSSQSVQTQLKQTTTSQNCAVSGSEIKTESQLSNSKGGLTQSNLTQSKLTQDQVAFLHDQKIPLDRVFDATGMRTQDWKRAMGDLGMLIASGVSPCNEYGHTLRTRAGHCVQCSPENISYLRRHDENGQVYIAYSPIKKLIKIGTAQDSLSRIRNLNSYRYGGATDWHRWFAVQCDRAGKVEADAHHSLSEFSVAETYFKNGSDIECRELFNCTIVSAVDAVNHALKNVKCSARVIQKYEPVGATKLSKQTEHDEATRSHELPKRVEENTAMVGMEGRQTIKNETSSAIAASGVADDYCADRESLIGVTERFSKCAPKGMMTLQELELALQIADSSIDVLSLSQRTNQALTKNKIFTVRQILGLSSETFCQLVNVDRFVCNEVIENLAGRGLRLRENDTPHQTHHLTSPMHFKLEESATNQGALPSPPRPVISEPEPAIYSVGDVVRHPKKEEWGTGKVISFRDERILIVDFDNVGKKTLDLKVGELIMVSSAPLRNEANLADRENWNRGLEKAACTNCGQPTHFGERATPQRVALGWCDSCFKNSQRTFEDKVTGEKRYFDEFRTIEGVKHPFYNPR